MKKKLFIISLILLMSIPAVCQEAPIPVNEVTGRIQYVFEGEAKGTKDELYRKAYQWFINTFVPPQYVIQLQDKEAGVLVGLAGSPLIYQNFGNDKVVNMTFKASMYISDGKYKLVLSSIRVAAALDKWNRSTFRMRYYVIDQLYRENGKPRKVPFLIKDTFVAKMASIHDSFRNAMVNDLDDLNVLSLSN